MRNSLVSFSLYVPLDVCKSVIINGGKTDLLTTSRHITLLLIDVRYLDLACDNMERTAVTSLVAEYFDLVSEIVRDTQGIMSEFFGTAIQVIWNAPNSVVGHASVAAKASLDMKDAFRALCVKWSLRDVHMEIGIHSALADVGNIGASTRFKYGVKGEARAVCASIQTLNSRYGSEILCSSSTYAELGKNIVTKPVSLFNSGSSTFQIHEIIYWRDYPSRFGARFSSSRQKTVEVTPVTKRVRHSEVRAQDVFRRPCISEPGLLRAQTSAHGRPKYLPLLAEEPLSARIESPMVIQTRNPLTIVPGQLSPDDDDDRENSVRSTA
eukprot:235918_1